MAIVDLVPIRTHLVHGIAKSAAVLGWARRRHKLTSVPALAVCYPRWCARSIRKDRPRAKLAGAELFECETTPG